MIIDGDPLEQPLVFFSSSQCSPPSALLMRMSGTTAFTGVCGSVQVRTYCIVLYFPCLRQHDHDIVEMHF